MQETLPPTLGFHFDATVARLERNYETTGSEEPSSASAEPCILDLVCPGQELCNSKVARLVGMKENMRPRPRKCRIPGHPQKK